MQWFRKQNIFLRVLITLALIMPVILIPIFSAIWTARNADASQPGLSGLQRPHSATSIFGSSTGKHSHQIYPGSVMPGRKFPGVAGHAARRAGRAVLSSHIVHANNAFAANVIASSDTTPAPFGPQPRNGPQAAVDPTNANHIVLVYNDYTPNGQGGISTAGYVTSTDGGAHWSAAQLVHGLLKIDGGAYDGASDPGVVFDAAGNAYLTVTTFNQDDWSTGVFVAKMAASSSSFGALVKVAAFNDTHHVVEYARLAVNAAGSSLYLTFNALSASPQAPNSTLASAWTSQLYFAASSDGGQTWSVPLGIGAGPQDYWAMPAVDWNGAIFVFYSGAPGLEIVQSSNGGQSWSSPRSLQSINMVGEQRGLNDVYINPGPAVAVDPGSQTLYVAYDGGKFILSKDDGATWSSPIDVLGSRFTSAFLASIGVDASTHAVSVGGYSTANDAGQNSFGYYYAQSADGGNHFSSPALVSDNVSLPPAPAFGSIGRASSVASGGNFAHVFWTDTNGTGGNEQIVTASVNVGQPMMGALQNSWDSTQTLPPWGLVFASVGTQNIGVANYGQGSIGTVTATPCNGCGWLTASVSPTSNAWVVTVTTSAATSQSGTLTINASGLNNSITIPVQLIITQTTPAYTLSATGLSFTSPQGIDPPTQAVSLTDANTFNAQVQASTGGDSALYSSFSNGAPAILLTPGIPAGLLVQVSAAGLSPGVTSHQLVVSDGTTSLTITITITITTALAQLTDPGSSLNFSYHQQDATSPAAQSVTLANSGGGTLDWQASTDASWLSLGTTSGSIAPSASQQVSVTVNPTGLPTGTSIGHIILGGDAQALNLPEELTVYMVVSPPANAVSKTWYFAEGFVSSGFSEFLTLANPNAQMAIVSVTYLTQPVNQSPKPPFTLHYTVNPQTRYTVAINSQPGIVQNDQVSLVVNASVPIVAERPMYFRYTPLSPNPTGGTDVVGATHLGSAFFFPFVQFGSDAQSGSPTLGVKYVTYLTVLNQNNAPVNVSISYEGAGSLYTVTHRVAANTRGTISLMSDFPLASGPNTNSYLYATSLLVTTDLPVVVELPSYFTMPQPSSGFSLATGTDEIGASNPQADWDFAEGYTGTNGSPFQTYIDLANFGDAPSQVTLTLSLTSSANAHSIKTYQTTVPPQSSISVWLNPIVCPTGVTYCGQSVATQVTASQPVVADRQMFFNYGGNTPGATAVVGAASGPQSTFYFAEGYTGSGFTEYLTFVNPASNSANESVTVRYLIQGGTPKTITIAQLQPGQRWTEIVNRDIGPNRSVSVVVTATGGALIVERPMYFHFHAMAFGGSDVIGYSPGD
jgi:Viral BACON domain